MPRDPQELVIIDGMYHFTEFVVADLAEACLDNLVRDTPKDTEWASAHWRLSVGQSLDTPIPDTARDDKLVGINVAKTEQFQTLTETLDDYTLDDGPIYISNTVPYIERLNAGHSPQAAPGFVERAVDKAFESVRRTSRETGSGDGGFGRVSGPRRTQRRDARGRFTRGRVGIGAFGRRV